MKKTLTTMILCLLMGASLIAETGNQPMATVTTAIGDVFVKRIQAVNWTAIAIGSQVFEGDKIRTKESGKAEVLFDDGSIVFIGTDTEIEFIKELDKKTKRKKRSVFLFFGSIWNKITTGSSFEVESIHALATVKGTKFNVSVRDVMEVWVKEGIVDIVNQHGKVEAKEGSYTRVSKELAPTKRAITNESEYPSEISVTYTGILEFNIPSSLYQEQWVKVSGVIKDPATSELIKESVNLSVSTSEDLYVSTDKSSQAKTLEITVSSAQFDFYVYSQGDSESLTLSSSITETNTQYLKFYPEVTEKDVFVEFKNKEGVIRKLQASFVKE